MEWPKMKVLNYQDETERKNPKRIRKSGCVPAVIYRDGKEPTYFKVLYGELERFFIHNKGSVLVELEYDDGATKKAVFKEIQRDPVKDTFLHVDLYEVLPDKEVKAKLPIEFVGTPKGTKIGGKFERLATHLTVRVKGEHLPNAIKIDVSDLDVGDTLLLEQVPPMEHIKFLETPKKLLCLVSVTRAAKEAAPGEAEAEAEA
jgi:large subunit ribosomal protein L25